METKSQSSRRDFIQKTGLVAAVLSLAPGYLSALNYNSILNSNDKIRVGFIGLGKLAYERNVRCLCADLMVNPILIDWYKNLAARLAPFPGLDMGYHGNKWSLNYLNWGKDDG